MRSCLSETRETAPGLSHMEPPIYMRTLQHTPNHIAALRLWVMFALNALTQLRKKTYSTTETRHKVEDGDNIKKGACTATQSITKLLSYFEE